jgi:hypothetical protein
MPPSKMQSSMYWMKCARTRMRRSSGQTPKETRQCRPAALCNLQRAAEAALCRDHVRRRAGSVLTCHDIGPPSRGRDYRALQPSGRYCIDHRSSPRRRPQDDGSSVPRAGAVSLCKSIRNRKPELTLFTCERWRLACLIGESAIHPYLGSTRF